MYVARKLVPRAPMLSRMHSGKVALITGASSGIGQATSVEFARHDFLVSLTGRNSVGLERTSQLCQGVGLDASKVHTLTGDLTMQSDAKEAVDSTIRKFGKLDILVNNAGLGSIGNMTNCCDLEEFDRVILRNTKSMLMVTKYAVPHLLETKGAIVNVSSILSQLVMENMLFYGMSKAACDYFTKSISVELGRKGIRVNSVNPGLTDTGTAMRLGMSPEDYQKFLAHQKVLHPLGRNGESEDVARLIRFLASDESFFVSGAIVPIDGARSNTMPH